MGGMSEREVLKQFRDKNTNGRTSKCTMRKQTKRSHTAQEKKRQYE